MFLRVFILVLTRRSAFNDFGLNLVGEERKNEGI